MFGAPELIILLFVVLGPIWLGLQIWAIYDVATRPDWVWPAANVDKTTWLILSIVGLAVCGILSIVYLVSIRPRVQAAQAQGPAAAGWWQASDLRWYPPPRPTP